MGCAASSSVQPALLKHSQSRLFNGKKKDTWPGIFATLTDSNDDFVSNTEYKNDIISFPEEINKADNEPESMVNSYFESLAATDIDESGWNILLILGRMKQPKITKNWFHKEILWLLFSFLFSSFLKNVKLVYAFFFKVGRTQIKEILFRPLLTIVFTRHMCSPLSNFCWSILWREQGLVVFEMHLILSLAHMIPSRWYAPKNTNHWAFFFTVTTSYFVEISFKLAPFIQRLLEYCWAFKSK